MSTANDKLSRLFEMQTSLNDVIFEKHNIQSPTSDRTLTMREIIEAFENGELGVNDLPNVWLSKYSQALSEELAELNEDLLWKWWSKDKIDIQNIRVELVDITHFLISAMLCCGMTPEYLLDLYQQKHAINLKRQEEGYNQTTKSETDNKGIK